MKIVHLISSLDKGGAESQLVELIKQQLKDDNQIEVYYFKGNSYWADYLNSKKVKCYNLRYNNSYNLFKLIYSIYIISKLINKFKPNIIHAHLNLAEVVLFFLSFIKKNTKLLISKHLDSFILSGSNSNKINFFSKLFENLILSRADKIICISRSVYNFFVDNTNLKKNKFFQIYYGIDYKFYDSLNNFELENFYKKNNLKKDEYIIGTISRHVPQKNLQLLLTSYKNFIDKYNIPSKLIMVGDGKLNKQLKSRAKELSIEKSVIWINFYENNSILFKVFNVFCLTSNYEGLGLVLLEGLSAKTPIIATNISAIPEIIKNNYNGYLFEKNNFKQLSDLIFKVYNSDNSEIINNGRKLIEEKFSLEKMSKNISEIYQL